MPLLHLSIEHVATEGHGSLDNQPYRPSEILLVCGMRRGFEGI
jgi:hypothetical protein